MDRTRLRPILLWIVAGLLTLAYAFVLGESMVPAPVQVDFRDAGDDDWFHGNDFWGGTSALDTTTLVAPPEAAPKEEIPK